MAFRYSFRGGDLEEGVVVALSICAQFREKASMSEDISAAKELVVALLVSLLALQWSTAFKQAFA